MKAEAQESQIAQRRTRLGLIARTVQDKARLLSQIPRYSAILTGRNVAIFGISHIWNHSTAISPHTCSLELDPRPQVGSWTVTIITARGLDAAEGELRAKVIQGQIRRQEQQQKHIKMEMNTSTGILGHKVEVCFSETKNCCRKLLQTTTSFLGKSQSGLSVLNTPVAADRACTKPAKQSLEKSVIHDVKSPLEKLNPSQVSHFSTASGLPLTLAHH